MTWTKRKTTDLIRLLEEYKREIPKRVNRIIPPRVIELIGEGKLVLHLVVTPEEIESLINRIEKSEATLKHGEDPLLAWRNGLDSPWMLGRLRWWCDLVKDRYGMKQHTAITWLLQQYHDKEGDRVFSRKWGAGVDSTARRLGQKVKYHQAAAPSRKFLGRRAEEEYEAALKGDADIYQLTFKLLKLWPEPGSSGRSRDPCRK